VRIHTDGRAAESAQAVSASAYTVGHHIVFGRDKYAPDTVAGKRLLAHELAHVVQQRGADLDSEPVLRRQLTGEGDEEERLESQFAGNDRLERAFRNSPAIHIGESGDGVRLVQEALVHQGFQMPGSTKPTGELDGQFGQETFDTFRQFQAQQGLKVDGIVGHETLRELDRLEAARPDQPPLLKPQPGEEPSVIELPGGLQILLPSGALPGEVPEIPGGGGIPNVFGQDLPNKDDRDLARVSAKGVSLRITAQEVPKRSRGSEEKDRIGVSAFLQATASVVVLPGSATDTFTFAFIQVCRPFEDMRAVYHKPGAPAGNEIDWNPGANVRPEQDAKGNVVQNPKRLAAFDVDVEGTFTPMVSQKREPDPKKRAAQKRSIIETRKTRGGALTDLFFEDSPTSVFFVEKEHDPKDKDTGLKTSYNLAVFETHSFFYTALVVQLPSGKIKPLKSFFWEVQACETLKPKPGETGYLENLMKPKDIGTIKFSAIFDCRTGNCSESELDLSKFRTEKVGTPVSKGHSCNEIVKAAADNTKPTGPGTFDITCK
jgi:hypothetical protein